MPASDLLPHGDRSGITLFPRERVLLNCEANMASGYPLPPPAALDIHDAQVADKWKKFKRVWTNYSLAIELNKKSEPIQVTTLLTVIGEEAREVFSTFTVWAEEGDEAKIVPVLEKVATCCQPCKNVPFERYRFNRRVQEPGESYDHYWTALRMLAEGCDFHTITADEILRDCLVFGIKDDKVRERLLRECTLTLPKTDEICRADESMCAQMKVVSDTSETTINAVKSQDHTRRSKEQPSTSNKPCRECWNCGRIHEYHLRELCPAYGKTCSSCQKPNHFAAKCRSKTKTSQKHVKALDNGDDPDEVFPTEVSAVHLDDSQLVTLKLESGNYLHFQADTGAQCNVIPLSLYKKATKDLNLTQVIPAETQITAYGGSTVPVVGRVLIRVWHGEFRY